MWLWKGGGMRREKDGLHRSNEQLDTCCNLVMQMHL